MADEFNSMQAQLGLVGQPGSFNPLGIPTPAPPAAPMVKHPGEVSRDIVAQTQTTAVNTVQMASISRSPQLNFGPYSMQGPAVPPAVSAFAAQYQQNMAGIQANQLNPYSAQMMSAMSGVGGFNSGMFPNPAMMTAPGYGIYRPFMPPPPPAISPFPQVPALPTPFTPMPPPPMFQTPLELSNNIAIQAGQRRTAAMFAMPGAAARAATDVGLGYMGAGAGASIGAAFGPTGALIGGGLGAMAGLFAGENLGLASTAQHMVDRLNPFRTMALRSQQIMGMSQNFVTAGPDLNPFTGQGLSQRGSTHLARMLEDTAYNTAFRRETSARYSVQDLTRITNLAGQQGLLNDTQSVEQIHDRVKGIARMLTGFMKIANEPNVRDAIKQMGQMRTMGLSFGEMMDTAIEMRSYSRMAGTTMRGLMDAGGMPGAMVFQQAGLSAGLGMRVGAGALASAQAAVASGSFSPQRLSMLGGVQGVAQHEMEASAAMLRMPLLSASMGRFTAGGSFALDPNAMLGLRNGRFNVNDMATMGANNLINAVNSPNGGVGALAMAQLQAPEIQDKIGRALGPQGLQMLRMQQVMQTMRLMGVESNPGGYAIASQAMGFGSQLTLSDMSKASNPNYFRTLLQASRQRQMEERGLAAEEFERTRGGMIARTVENSEAGQKIALGFSRLYTGFRNFGESVSSFFGLGEGRSQARERGQVLLSTPESLIASTPEQVKRMMDLSDDDYKSALAQTAELGSRYRSASSYTQRGMFDSLVGNADLRAQNAYASGGLRAMFGGGIMEGVARLGIQAIAGGNIDFNRMEEEERVDRDKGSAIWERGRTLTDTERASSVQSLAKDTKLSEGAIRRLTATTGRLLGNAARTSSVSNRIYGVSDFNKAFEEAAKEAGIDLSKTNITTEQRAQIGALARNQAVGIEALSGKNLAFEPYASTDVLGRNKTLGELKQQQDALSAALFGKEGEGADRSGGTRDARTAVFSKLMGGKYSDRAVLMSMLGAASKTDPAAKKMYTEMAAEYLTDSKLQAEVAGVSKEMSGLADQRMLEKGGASLAKNSGSFKNAEEAVKSLRTGNTALQKATSLAEGKLEIFQNADNADTEVLLGGDAAKVSDRGMRGLMADYRSATSAKEKKAIARQAEQYLVRQGVERAHRVASGVKTPGEDKNNEARELINKTGEDVGKAFPQAVDTLESAARKLERAAAHLSNMSPDVDMEEDRD